MKIKTILIALLVINYNLSAQFNIDQDAIKKQTAAALKKAQEYARLKKAKEDAQKILGINASKPLTNDEVIKGLKEALKVGTNNSTAASSKLDGFYKNAEIKIPFPPEAQRVKDQLLALGMDKQIAKFEMTLNRAAEEAAKNAAPIFVNAITGMSISDGFTILKGENNAATKYLQNKTTSDLYTKFKPTVMNATSKVQLTNAWTPLTSVYNKIPGVQKVNTDLNDFVTNRAMEGLFKLIAKEELNIRKNPGARINDILKRVFGNTAK